ncbi:MAG: DM13 domain-containing protein [Sphingobacteriaceae bacterium]|nr:DM13 domain-containing protein [Sphingobacteriaceae bacterium]
MKQKLATLLMMSLLLACQKSEEVMPQPQPLPTIGESFTLLSRTSFSSRNGYTVSGTLEVWRDSTQYEFRFIDFQSSNGPDLDILVANGTSANPSIHLGAIQGLQGNYVYTYTDVDNRIKDFSSVVVWCSRFSVAFGLASFEP